MYENLSAVRFGYNAIKIFSKKHYKVNSLNSSVSSLNNFQKANLAQLHDEQIYKNNYKIYRLEKVANDIISNRKKYTFGNRSAITNFSNASRHNMFWRLQLIDYNQISADNLQTLFITLTYQDTFYRKFKTLLSVKKDLDNFRRSLQNHFKQKKGLQIDFFFFHKLEFTKKDIPHFHLFFVSSLSNTKENYNYMVKLISHLWAVVITSCLRKQRLDYKPYCNLFRKVGTNVRFINTANPKAVFHYISKEVSKTFQTAVNGVVSRSFVGRFWGIYGRTFYKKYTQDVLFKFHNSKQFFAFRRVLFKLIEKRGFSTAGFKKQLRYNSYAGMTAFFITDIRPFLRLFLDYIYIYPD